jgi:hypothetical protein
MSRADVSAAMELDKLPVLMTIEEAAAFLRIGRSAAYELGRQWRASNGETGIPVINFGRSLRVPRGALAQLIDRKTSAA